jgi:DNA-binding transcriptional regulator of glucitol operon
MAGRSYRFAWRPTWLAGHVVVLAAAVAMGYLGHWQLDVSDSKGFDLQNFGYALQWWAFSITGVVVWVRVIRDYAKPAGSPRSQPPEPAPPSAPPVAYRRYVMPTAVDSSDDPELSRYNDYLRSLGSDRDG